MLSSGNAQRAIVFLGLLSLVFHAGAREASNPVSSKVAAIHVHAAGFGDASATDIKAVLESAAGEIWQHCPRAQLLGIDVYHRRDHPMTNFERQRNGRVAIGLTARNTHWAQYGFQFAHEFIHALANFNGDAQPPTRYPKHANGWLEESLCETASLYTLRAMSRSWRNAPRYPPWKNYARWLDDYAQRRLAQPGHQLPAGTSFVTWFKQNEPDLRAKPEMHYRNAVIGAQLLPLFEEDPRAWETVIFLKRGSHRADASLAEFLAEWRAQCPRDLRPFLGRLAAVFGVQLPRDQR